MDYSVAPGSKLAPGESASERDSFSDVVLVGRLRNAIHRLNPAIPEEAREEALRKVLRVGTPSLTQTNRAFHKMLRDGVPVEYPRADGSIAGDHVRLIDFQNPTANDWLAVNQFTIIEGQHNRRPDIVVFVNGLPLGVIELKNAADEDATVWSAYAQLQTYKAEIPSLLHYNAALVVSDGLQARIGSITANQEWFKVWREVDADSSPPSTSGRGAGDEGQQRQQATLELETLIKGVFAKDRFLTLLLHFIVFEEDPDSGALHKIIAGYHQFHAVNAAVEETIRASGMSESGVLREAAGGYWTGAMQGGEPGDRRAGVVWHTQGSGKSFSMLFYAARVVRHPAMQNPTLVVLTDRNDLDDQLFGQFQRCHDILGQTPIQAADRQHLRELLNRASGGVIFTTIQKFAPLEPSPQPSPNGRGNHQRGGFDFAGLKEQARELRNKQTDAEALLWELLRNRKLAGAKFRRQHQFGEYIADFYCAEAKLVVECDGAPHRMPERQKVDQKRDAYLKSQGLTVLRFENSEVLSNSESILEKIATHLPSTFGRGAGGEGNVAPKRGNECLSDRRNIIVIADEAHRSQYDLIDGLGATHARCVAACVVHRIHRNAD
jgi:type I site-specific restriction-modification system R (restriction) subunit